MHVLVKGAGVAGLAVAHELAARGAHVTVIEKSASVGGGASWLAGGMLAPWCERESAEADVIRLGHDAARWWEEADRKSTRLNSSHVKISYAVFCLKKKKIVETSWPVLYVVFMSYHA